jgi:hypothetical protein
VTFIDHAGKAYLGAMHCLGAEFVAADCLTKAIVAEIRKVSMAGGGRPKRKGESQP